MNSARLRIFATCEISHPANFRRLQKFSQPEKFSGKFLPSLYCTGTPATKRDQKLLEVKLEK